jgi:hypothetical protein
LGLPTWTDAEKGTFLTDMPTNGTSIKAVSLTVEPFSANSDVDKLKVNVLRDQLYKRALVVLGVKLVHVKCLKKALLAEAIPIFLKSHR